MAAAARRMSSVRPASSEELQCWTQAASSLAVLAQHYHTSNSSFTSSSIANSNSSNFGSAISNTSNNNNNNNNANANDTIQRVNRLLAGWPGEDGSLPSEGMEGLRSLAKKLEAGMKEIQRSAEVEARLIDDASERIDVLLALRRAGEMSPLIEKRIKRSRAGSSTPGPSNNGTPSGGSRVSITLPARPSPATIAAARDPKARSNTNAAATANGHGTGNANGHGGTNASANGNVLRVGQKVAAKQAYVENGEVPNWIVAVITQVIPGDKHRESKYEVMDAEEPTATWTTTRRQLVPIPNASVPMGNPAHIDNFPQHKPGAIVRALYPETTCFYRAHVLSGPISAEVVEKNRHGKDVKRVIRHYLVQFEDDDNQEHQVDVHLVLEDSGFD